MEAGVSDWGIFSIYFSRLYPSLIYLPAACCQLDMSTLITPAGVQKGYKKAVRVVHPDKVGAVFPCAALVSTRINLPPLSLFQVKQSSDEVKFIADTVFNAVNDAFTQFRNKEM
jgi:hypothetical protein